MAHIGEIIILQPEIIVAEGKKDFLPPVGSILKTSSRKIIHYSVVVNQFVESKIPGRVPRPYGLDEEEVEGEHPQFSYLMGWMFQIVFFAQEENKIYEFPDCLPQIHSLLYKVEGAELTKLFNSFDIANAIFKIEDKFFPNRNICFAKMIRRIVKGFPEYERSEVLDKVYTSLSRIFRDDFNTLRGIMRDIEGK